MDCRLFPTVDLKARLKSLTKQQRPYKVVEIDQVQVPTESVVRQIEAGADLILLGETVENIPEIRAVLQLYVHRPLIVQRIDTAKTGAKSETLRWLSEGALDGIIVDDVEDVKAVKDYNAQNIILAVSTSQSVINAHSIDPEIITVAIDEDVDRIADNIKDLNGNRTQVDEPFLHLRFTTVKAGTGQTSDNGIGYLYKDISLPSLLTTTVSPSPIVKICGVKTVEAARVALDNGANMIGMILVPGRTRSVDSETALKISDFVRSYRRKVNNTFELDNHGKYFELNGEILRVNTLKRPKIVGVFRNQPLSEILKLQTELRLDMVQLHGSEPLEWCRYIPVPVIKRFTPGSKNFRDCLLPGYHYLSLLDSEAGGEGKLIDWTAFKDEVQLGARFLLAGGLTVENVQKAVKINGVIGVDVSGGVETHGVKDLEKVRKFVRSANE